jgi:hypothetical protein
MHWKAKCQKSGDRSNATWKPEGRGSATRDWWLTHFARLLRDGHHAVTRVRKDIGMDIDALHSTLLSLTLAFGKLCSAREKLPVAERTRSDFGRLLNDLEPDLRIATAMLAGELGFSVCRCCWPPEVLATDLEGRVRRLGPVESSPTNETSIRVRRTATRAGAAAKPGAVGTRQRYAANGRGAAQERIMTRPRRPTADSQQSMNRARPNSDPTFRSKAKKKLVG